MNIGCIHISAFFQNKSYNVDGTIIGCIMQRNISPMISDSYISIRIEQNTGNITPAIRKRRVQRRIF